MRTRSLTVSVALTGAEDEGKHLAIGIKNHKSVIADFTEELSATEERLCVVAHSLVELNASVAKAMNTRQVEHSEFFTATTNNVATSKMLRLAINSPNKSYAHCTRQYRRPVVHSRMKIVLEDLTAQETMITWRDKDGVNYWTESQDELLNTAAIVNDCVIWSMVKTTASRTRQVRKRATGGARFRLGRPAREGDQAEEEC